ncbi:MAG: hypothetical protein ACI8ZM_001724 [Crocinitomix sp.]|jgi:hypothetical protein
MGFIKNIFSKKKQQSKKVSKSEIQDIVKNFQKELPGKLAALNTIQTYQTETLEINPAKIKYIEATQEKIDVEIDKGMTLMKELSIAGIIDVENESVPYTAISNLDFYFDSWQIMRFTNLNGKIPLGTHSFELGLVFGRGMMERHPNLKWFYSAHDAEDGNLILLDSKNDIEINPLESIMRCKRRKEKNPFEEIEKKYLALLNSMHNYDRILIV